MKGTYTTTEDIFTATGYNQRGQVTGYTLGNGLSTTRGYDDFGFPTTIQTPGIQDLAYQFNAQTGNLNRREDVAKTLQEDFTYDNLMKNRLESWQVNTGTTYGVNYASNGNINTKTGLGAFCYNAPQPHAVSEIENTGNLVSEVEQIVKYTPFNKVDTIREGSYRLEITYGPDEARKITRLYNNNVLEKTKYYIGGNYEVEIDGSGNERKLHYIYGGDGLAAIFEKTSAAENLYYIHKDHLGSFTVVTDANGTMVEEMSFDPWGRKRNPTNWIYDSTISYANIFDRGFTGHEHLDEFSLINMNGRVYDPLLGRFMSPDNYIQAPDYTQNLNRYSYALNNPLIYTDPSGDFIAEAITLLAFTYFGGVQSNFLKSSASGSNPFNPANWDWSSPGTYVGLASGFSMGMNASGISKGILDKLEANMHQKNIDNFSESLEAKGYIVNLRNKGFGSYTPNPDLGGTSTHFYFLGTYSDGAFVASNAYPFVVEGLNTINTFRFWESTASTISAFHVPATGLAGFFMEPPGPDSSVKDSGKRIPEGEYNVVRHWRTKHYGRYSLQNSSLLGNRSGILMHYGTSSGWTEGCLLPAVDWTNNTISGSLEKLNALQLQIDRANSMRVNIFNAFY